MTVVLFQLFGLPCFFCARLCRSCLDDLKIFFFYRVQFPVGVEFHWRLEANKGGDWRPKNVQFNVWTISLGVFGQG